MMKQVFFLLAACYCSSGTMGQQCDQFYLLQQGKTIEMTSYNNKGKPNGLMSYKVGDVSRSGGTTNASIDFNFKDEKQKQVSSGNMTMKCQGGVYQVDMRQFVPAQSLEQMKTMEGDVGVYLSYPVGMSVGDNLPPGEATINAETGGMKVSTVINITDRKVEGKESVSSPAGNWDCFKISSKMTITTKMAGMGIPIKVNSVEYYAPGFGVVKTETKYGRTELTAIR